MRLNRYNYEEFFILYLDNELDAEGRREVEAFVQENPDLKAELDMVMQSKLTPDTDISFADKGSLLRFDNASISLANYEEWLTSYIDNELTGDERKSVEEFVVLNPSIQKELNLLQQAKLQPEEIVFPYKESLYRRTEKARVISIRWVRIAAAAVLLLAFGTTAVILLNNKKDDNTTNSSIAKMDPGKPKADNNETKQGNNEVPSNDKAASVTARQQKEESNEVKETRTSNPVIFSKSNNEKKDRDEPAKIVESSLANNDTKKDNPDSDPQTGNNPTVNGNKVDPVSTIGAIDQLNRSASLKGNLANSDVTTFIPPTSINETGAVKQDDPDVQFASDNSGNRGLRGFFRKVTRTIEKRTNIKTTNDDDRLLIAGLAIKM